MKAKAPARSAKKKAEDIKKKVIKKTHPRTAVKAKAEKTVKPVKKTSADAAASKTVKSVKKVPPVKKAISPKKPVKAVPKTAVKVKPVKKKEVQKAAKPAAAAKKPEPKLTAVTAVKKAEKKSTTISAPAKAKKAAPAAAKVIKKKIEKKPAAVKVRTAAKPEKKAVVKKAVVKKAVVKTAVIKTAVKAAVKTAIKKSPAVLKPAVKTLARKEKSSAGKLKTSVVDKVTVKTEKNVKVEKVPTAVVRKIKTPEKAAPATKTVKKAPGPVIAATGMKPPRQMPGKPAAITAPLPEVKQKTMPGMKPPVKLKKDVIKKIAEARVKGVAELLSVAEIEAKEAKTRPLKIFLPVNDLPDEAEKSYTVVRPAGLPEEYGENSLLLMVVDPNNVYLNWELAGTEVPSGPRTITIRLYDVTGKDYDGTDFHSFLDIRVASRTGSGFFEIMMSGKELVAEIGLVDSKGNFKPILRSSRVSLPPLLKFDELGIVGKLNEAGIPVGY